MIIVTVYLNLTAGAWRQMRKAWTLPRTLPLLRQAWLAAPLRSLLARGQDLLVREGPVDEAEAIFILGFWRSGTTLMHELLAADPRFGFPSNYACFHPHHFVFSQKAALSRNEGEIRRPQDGVTTGWGTPQEDEFALLCLGARSPYEGLIAAADFGRAMMLADPEELPAEEKETWERVFLRFFRALRFAHGDKPLVLKSPTHSYRVKTLRRLVPKARFILMVRDPAEVFESMMKTYRAFSLRYGLVPGMPNRELRELILRERVRCEAKLQEGLAGLGPDRLAIVRFEDLTAEPVAGVEKIYRQFGLTDFESVRPRLLARVARGSGVKRPASLPPPPWQERMAAAWSEIFNRYGYRAPC